MENLDLTLFQGLTDSQKELRKSGIGGSDAAAILNISKYRTVQDVYNDKLGEADGFEGNLATVLGNHNEDLIRRLYEVHIKTKLIKPSEAFVHSDYPWMRCNLDFHSEDNTIVGEIKFTSSYKQWGDEGTDEIPNEYLIQCAHNCIVSESHFGISYTKFPCIALINKFGKWEMKEYFYTRNAKLEKVLIHAEDKFWNDNVLKQIQP